MRSAWTFLVMASVALGCSSTDGGSSTPVTPDVPRDVAAEPPDDTASPDAPAPDAVPDAAAPDASPDAPAPDAPAMDAPADVSPDVSPPDASPPDVSAPDASPPDADAGPFEEFPAVDVPPPPTGRLLPRCEETEPSSFMPTPVASTLVGTVSPFERRVSIANPFVNPSTESGERSYRARSFDMYRRGPAQARVRRTDLGGATAFGERRSIAYFVAASDYQLTDDESPMRFAGVDTPGLLSSGLRPQEAYLPRIASAMNRTLAALMRPERPFQFGVFAGDCADTGQLNELRWFIELMDGARGVHTDSGADDDPVPGPDNDPKDPFDATPFPAPWYYVPGNHDLMVVGIFLPTDARRAAAIGTNASTGTRDYRMWYAPVRSGTVIADRNRALVTREDIVRELRAGPARPGPTGHGFAAMPDFSLGANYAADVVPGLLRMLAFDTSDDTGGSTGLVHRRTIDRWLRVELDRARADGVLVMLSSHHPVDDITRTQNKVGLPVSDAVAGDDIQRLVAGYPNVIAWFVGHQHAVRVRPLRGAAGTQGFWEIQSGSIADWPSQARVMEIVDNGNNTLSLFGTMVDYETTSCMERRYRRLTLIDYLSGWAPELTGAAGDRNVELVIPIAPEARAAVARARAAAPARIESETTLRGMR